MVRRDRSRYSPLSAWTLWLTLCFELQDPSSSCEYIIATWAALSFHYSAKANPSHSSPSSLLRRPHTHPPRILYFGRFEELRPSAMSSSTTAEPHIPRPLNAFFLYRRDQNNQLRATSAESFRQNLVSKAVGERWKEESPQVRLKYEKLARAAQEEHKRLYPDYKYKPGLKKDKKGKSAPRRPRKKECAPARPVVLPGPPSPSSPSPERCTPAPSLPDVGPSACSSSSWTVLPDEPDVESEDSEDSEPEEGFLDSD